MNVAGADPGIFDWGVQTLVQKGLLNFYLFIIIIIIIIFFFGGGGELIVPPLATPTSRSCTL